jgi:hypothetical protein
MTRKPTKTPGAPAPVAVADVPASAQAPRDDLPNAIDVDAKTINGPVLTRQGWVVPDEAHQAKLRKRAELERELGQA